jgi:Uncharacterized conserved protein
LSFFASTWFAAHAIADDAPGAAKPIRVALFRDKGVSKGVVGLAELLRSWPQLQVQEVKAAEIRAGKLAEFDVVVFPGGGGRDEALTLDDQGRAEVKAFVERGGGYLGICAGAYLASAGYDWSLHILDAQVLDRAHWKRGTGDVQVGLTSAGRKLLAAESDRQTIYFHQGPLLAPAGKPEIPDYETLGTFDSEIAKNGAPKGVMKGTTAIAAAPFGQGRVICFSPHPEKTEAVKGQVLKAIQWAAMR